MFVTVFFFTPYQVCLPKKLTKAEKKEAKKLKKVSRIDGQKATQG